MGLKATKPIPISPDCIASVGISKSTESDVFYPELQHQPELLHSALLLDSPYRVYAVTHDERDIPEGLTSLMQYAKYHGLILEPLEQLVAEANQKKMRLSKVAYKMSFVTYLQRALYFAKLNTARIQRISRRACCNCLQFSYIISFPCCVLLWLGNLLLIGLAILLDIITCHHCCRETSADLEAIVHAIIENPDLDTKRIDDELRKGLDQLVSKLQLYYPEYFVFLHVYQQDIPTTLISWCCTTSMASESQLVHWMICFVEKQSPTAIEAGLSVKSPSAKAPSNSSKVLPPLDSPSIK